MNCVLLLDLCFFFFFPTMGGVLAVLHGAGERLSAWLAVPMVSSISKLFDAYGAMRFNSFGERRDAPAVAFKFGELGDIRLLSRDGDSDAELRYRTFDDLVLSLRLIRRALRRSALYWSDESYVLIDSAEYSMDGGDAASEPCC